MNKLKQLQEEYQKLLSEQETLLAKGDDATQEDLERIDAIDGELDAKAAAIAALQKAEKAGSRLQARKDFLGKPATPPLHDPENAGDGLKGEDRLKAIRSMPSGRVTAFKSDEGASAREKAYRFAKWFMGAVCGQAEAKAYCQGEGIPILYDAKAMSENQNALGGAIVPSEFENDLIDLRESYGVARQVLRIKTMRRDTLIVPRRAGGLTAYAVGEGATGTYSDKNWDNVELVARKWMVLSKFSTELDEDALIDLGNDLAEEIAYAFAVAEDDALFNGDGTSTYHRITGVRAKLKAVDATIANIAGLVVASGNLWSEFVLSDFNNVVGTLPEYADNARTAWITHKKFYHSVMEKLMLASGGVTAAEVAAGRRQKTFMGYPVIISQKMPKTDANSQIACLFGDLSLAGIFGDRRMTTLATSEHVNFNEDQIAIRGTERFDINIHDVGDVNDAGPVVGLISAAA